MIYGEGPESCRSNLTPGEARDKASHTESAMSAWLTLGKSSGRQGSGVLLRCAMLHACSHTSLLGAIGAAWLRWENTTRSSCTKLPWILPYVPLPFADFNLYPSVLINRNNEFSSFSKFCGSFQQIIKTKGSEAIHTDSTFLCCLCCERNKKNCILWELLT